MPDGSHLDVVTQMVCPHLIGTLLEQATPAGLLLVLLLPVNRSGAATPQRQSAFELILHLTWLAQASANLKAPSADCHSADRFIKVAARARLVRAAVVSSTGQSNLKALERR
jgi:hypothetical protein